MQICHIPKFVLHALLQKFNTFINFYYEPIRIRAELCREINMSDTKYMDARSHRSIRKSELSFQRLALTLTYKAQIVFDQINLAYEFQ
jgi:hypothetical protein